MKKVLQCHFEQMIVGVPQIRGNLTIIPILASEEDSADSHYLLLDEALKLGAFEAKEIDEHGRVNEIQVVNRAEKPVLILDGEELVGAKQNRIVNATLLIPASSKIVIPVSCVERGRWHHNSAAFQSSEAFGYSQLRRQKTAQVTESLRVSAAFTSDQHQVWSEIDRKQAAMGSRSDTSAMHEIYVDYENEMQKYLQGLEPQQGQIGLMVFINGRFNCLDVLNHCESLKLVYDKLLKSYAMEAIEVRNAKPNHEQITPSSVLEQLAQAKAEFYKSPGEGTDFRIRSAQYIGAGLIHGDQVLHLSAFQAEAEEQAAPNGNIARPSRRRRNRE